MCFMPNIESCFTAYPDYEIIAPTLRQVVPTTRPDYGSPLLSELRETNNYLRYRIEEMNARLIALENFIEANKCNCENHV